MIYTANKAIASSMRTIYPFFPGLMNLSFITNKTAITAIAAQRM